MKASPAELGGLLFVLEGQLSRLRNRMPKLRVLIANQGTTPPSNNASVSTKPNPTFDVDEKIVELEKQYPKIDPDSSDIPNRLVDRYNFQLDAFYSQMRKYYDFANSVNLIANRSVVLELYICNIPGTVPANNVRANIQFDDNVMHVARLGTWSRWKKGQLCSETEALVKLFGPSMEPPKPPHKPSRHELDSTPLPSPYMPDLDRLRPPDAINSFIDIVDRQIKLWARGIDHCDQYEFGAVIVIYRNSIPSSPKQWKTFLICDELPEYETGKIVIRPVSELSETDIKDNSE